MSKLRGGVCDARCQQFHREIAKKEERLKNLWFIKNKQRLYENLDVKNFSRNAVISKQAQQQQQKKKIVHPRTDSTDTVKQQKTLPSWRPPSKAARDVDLMRPVKAAVRNILYVPKDESFAAKKKYKEKPEDRYYYPYCSSWMFGWRLKDYPPIPISEHGVRSVIQSSFYRRNASSIQRDPDWYRMCQTGDPKNFNEILTY
ncbi:hypothetical protein TSAR_012325 [Trichomalopsis sarcophagae]|uniref:Sperm microtubule inner protein 1 C-terminal domain-containing protein n=1 Tax=Trichomalopsis sarcophagae TaxID=543379 RepID=A0A232FGU0_9HYME|nr:hypothetical protein TSAR_012325 [Trichomalopsis sarcophagae]